jgi:hypothetical protein
MKNRVSKKTLSELPSQVSALVSDLCSNRGIRTFSAEAKEVAYCSEDARCWGINEETGASKEARVAGAWAGHEGIRPGATVRLPEGCWFISEELFLGKWLVTVVKGTGPRQAATQVADAEVKRLN